MHDETKKTIQEWLPKNNPFQYVGDTKDLSDVVLDGTFDLLDLAEHIRKQTIEEMKRYHEKQVSIHTHFIEDYEQAPFKWHEGAREEAKKSLQALTELE